MEGKTELQAGNDGAGDIARGGGCAPPQSAVPIRAGAKCGRTSAPRLPIDLRPSATRPDPEQLCSELATSQMFHAVEHALRSLVQRLPRHKFGKTSWFGKL